MLGLAHRHGEAVAADVGERFRAGAEIVVRVSQRRLGPDEPDRKTLRRAPALADTRIENRRFASRIGADKKEPVGRIDTGNGGIEVVGAIFVARRQPGLFSETQVQLLKTFADQACDRECAVVQRN